MTVEINKARNILFQSLMNVPHRDYDKLVPLFREAIDEDPDFISRACVYFANGDNTKIRDQQDIAIITLLQSPTKFSEFRIAGQILIADFPPYRIMRILNYISRSDRRISRLAKVVATNFIQSLEKSPGRFDGVAVGSFKSLKNIYRHYHIQPDKRAQAILFDNDPPADSKSAILKQIAASTDSVEQAKLVIKHKIPYRIASTIMPKFSAEVGVALMSVMTPTEALNSRKWIEKSGLLEMPEVNDMYLAKLKKATASLASADHRASAQGDNVEVQEAIDEAKQKVIDSQMIESNIMLLIDRSSSMDSAIRTSIELGSRIAPLCAGELSVFTFNDRATEIKIEDQNSYRGWQQAFKTIRAGGMTSIGIGLQKGLAAGYLPEKIIVVTDGHENQLPSFANVLNKYVKSSETNPHIVTIFVDDDSLTYRENVASTGLQHDVYTFDGDYYLFDQVAATLGGPAAKSIIDMIMEIELPTKEG